MRQIKLDHSKLFGFKILPLQAQAESNSTHATKLGSKIGQKPVVKLGAKVGAKPVV